MGPNALTAALLVTQILLEATTAAEKINALIARARDEGRDLTDDELQQLQDERKAAIAGWQRVLAGEPMQQ